MPRHPSTGISRPSTDSDPSNRAPGSGLSSFVRGSRAPYIHSRGRWNRGTSAPSKRISHPTPSNAPTASPERMDASRTPIHSSPPARGPGSVTFAARGPSAEASNRVNHSDPTGSAPARLCTV
jgi:hypothetical protein